MSSRPVYSALPTVADLAQKRAQVLLGGVRYKGCGGNHTDNKASSDHGTRCPEMKG